MRVVCRRRADRDQKHPQNGFSSGLPTRPNATIRSPVAASTNLGRPAANTAHQAPNALIFRLFCSLRLSVRTPPFHGGESGSIPLGSANNFNGLTPLPAALSNKWTINAHERGATNGYSLHCDRGLRRTPLRDPPDAAILLPAGYLIPPVGANLRGDGKARAENHSRGNAEVGPAPAADLLRRLQMRPLGRHQCRSVGR